MANYRDKFAAPRADIYQEVTDRIIRQLEAGVAPWVRPWVDGQATAGITMPRNIKTNRAYSGVNVLILWNAAAEAGFTSQDWLTYKQCEEMGANVRKGSKGTRVVYADRFIPKEERAKAAAENRDANAVYFLKSFTVFNRDQIEGLPEVAPAVPMTDRERHEAGEALIAASGADFRTGGNRAFYSPGHDFIQVPDQRQFKAQIDYYRTAAHELTHWTGHASRLNRNLLNAFGSRDYAREELVAEMGAAFICASLGIEPTVQHSDYLGSWLSVLREDNKAIFRAASLASRAADFLLGKVTEAEAEEPLAEAA